MEPLYAPSRCLRVFKPRRLLLSLPILGRRLPSAHTCRLLRLPFIPEALPEARLLVPHAPPCRHIKDVVATSAPVQGIHWTPPTPRQPEATKLRPHPFSGPGRPRCSPAGHYLCFPDGAIEGILHIEHLLEWLEEEHSPQMAARTHRQKHICSVRPPLAGSRCL